MIIGGSTFQKPAPHESKIKVRFRTQECCEAKNNTNWDIQDQR